MRHFEEVLWNIKYNKYIKIFVEAIRKFTDYFNGVLILTKCKCKSNIVVDCDYEVYLLLGSDAV